MDSMEKFLCSLFLVSCLMAVGACTEGSHSLIPQAETIALEHLTEGQIIDTATGRSLSIDELLERVSRREVLYLGEEHHNRFHVENALQLLNRLTAKSRRPVLAIEMFGWDGQGLIDRYVGEDGLGRQEFVEQIGWQKNWGGPFEDYEPLVSFAKSHQIRLIGMNPPKSLVRLVARNGLEQARLDAAWTKWGMQEEAIIDDPPYRERILQQLRACHDGGPATLYQRMYEASMVRDEGMAKTIVMSVESIRKGQDPLLGPVVSYTGGGHIQYNLPVPKRVARRLSQQVEQVSVYMMAFEPERSQDVREVIGRKIADYVWLTPLGAHGAPRSC